MAQVKKHKVKTTSKKRKRRRSYKRLKFILFIFIIICILIGLLILNRHSISLWHKGYSKEERKILLELDKESLKEYLDIDDKLDILPWNEYSNDGHFYDYILYQEKHSDSTMENTIEYIDSFYDIYPSLEQLGYSKELCRSWMSTQTVSDFKILADNEITYEVASSYLEINGCQLSDIPAYINSGLEPLSAVLNVTYPFINSTIESGYTYKIDNPKKYDVLIKAGFTLGSDYEPSDLVELDLPKYDDTLTYKMRQKAADALKDMANDAKNQGLYLGVRSAYRSYADQDEVYNYYISLYGYEYTAQIASIPGSSEHQLGLGVDLTSQSVIDGIYGSFDETEEYTWVIQNCYKYGFILRYPEDKTDLTGAMNEPWHFRYVGVKAATEIYNNNWTLEEYILNHGFSYSLTRQ